MIIKVNKGKVKVCESEKVEQAIAEAVGYIVSELKEERTPEFYTWNATAGGQVLMLDYKNRKHVFAYTSSASITLSASDFSVALVQNDWKNVSFPNGTRFTVNTSCIVVFKCTDEVIP